MSLYSFQLNLHPVFSTHPLFRDKKLKQTHKPAKPTKQLPQARRVWRGKLLWLHTNNNTRIIKKTLAGHNTASRATAAPLANLMTAPRRGDFGRNLPGQRGSACLAQAPRTVSGGRPHRPLPAPRPPPPTLGAHVLEGNTAPRRRAERDRKSVV